MSHSSQRFRRPATYRIAILIVLVCFAVSTFQPTAYAAEPVLLVNSIVINAWSFPWGSGIMYRNERARAVPYHITGEESSTAFFPVGQPIGGLVGPEGRALVYRANCEFSPPDNIRYVCFHIDGVVEQGKYEGVVDLTNNSKADPLKITLSVTDCPVFPIIASLAGILLAVLLLWFDRGRRHYLSMKKRADDTKKEIETANGTQASKARWRGYTLNPEPYFSAFQSALEKYGTRRLIWDTSSKEYKELVAVLDLANAERQRYESEMPGRLDRLAKEVEVFKNYLDTKPLGTGIEGELPLFTKQASHLKGTPIPIGKLQERFVSWSTASHLFALWRTTAEQIVSYRLWCRRLQARVMENHEKEQLNDAEVYLTTVAQDLSRIESGEALETLREHLTLRIIYRLLVNLARTYNSWPVPATSEVKLGSQSFVSLHDILHGLHPIPIEATTPRLLDREIRNLDLVLIGFAVGVAVFTSMQTLYVGKTFGALTDYLAMFLLGGGTPTAIAALGQLVNRFVSRE